MNIAKYSAFEVAKFIINRYNDRNISISNLKLQKLLYFTQAIFLLNEGKACFKEEIEAWKLGPVVPCVYYEYRHNGFSSIDKIEGFDYDYMQDDSKYIDSVIDIFKDYSAKDLVELTHEQDPWKKTYERDKNNVINNELILEYFSSINWGFLWK